MTAKSDPGKPARGEGGLHFYRGSVHSVFRSARREDVAALVAAFAIAAIVWYFG